MKIIANLIKVGNVLEHKGKKLFVSVEPLKQAAE